MKLWLFDVLACPIDKFYPLKLYIFSFNEKEVYFSKILEVFTSRNIEKIYQEDLIHISEEKSKIRDQIVLENLTLDNYLQKIQSSIEELDNISDRTEYTKSKKCLKLLKSDVKIAIQEFLKDPDIKEINRIIPEIYLTNKIKVDLEIDSGILFCHECKRWYPIIDTIPRMLPDRYRDKKKEKEFLNQNKDLLNRKFLQKDLKPFNL